jgi:hypothetical protein
LPPHTLRTHSIYTACLHGGCSQHGQAFTVNLLIDKMTFILGREGNKLFFDSTDDVLDFNSAVAVVAQNVLGPEIFTEDLDWLGKSNGYITKVPTFLYFRISIFHKMPLLYVI